MAGMSELFRPTSPEMAVSEVLEEAFLVRAFRTGIIHETGKGFDWTYNGTDVIAEWMVGRETTLSDSLLQEVYGRDSIYDCGVSIKVCRRLEDWPEIVRIKDEILRRKIGDETKFEPIHEMEEGLALAESLELKIDFSVNGISWTEEAEYNLFDAEDEQETIEYREITIDEEPTDEEALEAVIPDEGSRLLFAELDDMASTIKQERTDRRLRQVMGIIRCIKESAVIDIATLLITGEFLEVEKPDSNVKHN